MQGYLCDGTDHVVLRSTLEGFKALDGKVIECLEFNEWLLVVGAWTIRMLIELLIMDAWLIRFQKKA